MISLLEDIRMCCNKKDVHKRKHPKSMSRSGPSELGPRDPAAVIRALQLSRGIRGNGKAGAYGMKGLRAG